MFTIVISCPWKRVDAFYVPELTPLNVIRYTFRAGFIPKGNIYESMLPYLHSLNVSLRPEFALKFYLAI